MDENWLLYIPDKLVRKSISITEVIEIVKEESEILERLHGTIPEVITGCKPGRVSQYEKILAIVQGMASCDLSIARLIYDKLRDSKEVHRIPI